MMNPGNHKLSQSIRELSLLGNFLTAVSNLPDTLANEKRSNKMQIFLEDWSL